MAFMLVNPLKHQHTYLDHYSQVGELLIRNASVVSFPVAVCLGAQWPDLGRQRRLWHRSRALGLLWNALEAFVLLLVKLHAPKASQRRCDVGNGH